MLRNSINKNRAKTIFTLFPKNKKLRLSKQNLKYLSKEKNMDNSVNNFNIYNNKNNIIGKTIINEKSNQVNSFSKNGLKFNLTNSKWNYNNNFNNNSAKPRINIASSISINFWKGKNNNNFKINNFIKKNNNRKKSAKIRENNFMGINKINNDRRSSIEQKYALNSKLFEQFINQYEQKIRKALFDIGINPDEKFNETNKDYFAKEYDKNYDTLPFLNNNINNNNEQKKMALIV